MSRLAILALACVAIPGCLRGGTFECREDAPCIRHDDTTGVCEQGWCAYPDLSCGSELRFSSNAGEGLADACVETGSSDDDDDGSSETLATTTSDETTSATTASCPFACDTPPSPCHGPAQPCAESEQDCEYDLLPPNSPCTEGNLCLQSTCDEFGQCNVNATTTCTAGGPCTTGAGSCNPTTGECEYPSMNEGTACEDGDICTEGDACDGEGRCAPGPMCPIDDPCESRSCIGGECVSGDMPNGTQCGPYAADRCCSGSCVDIASDDENCGGCDLECSTGQECESIAVATACNPHPERTSGRCECTSDLHCPDGQVCDEEDSSGSMNRCTIDPMGGSCPDAVFEYDVPCASYCYYD